LGKESLPQEQSWEALDRKAISSTSTVSTRTVIHKDSDSLMKERTVLGRTQSLQGFHKESLPHWQGQSSHKDSLERQSLPQEQSSTRTVLGRSIGKEQSRSYRRVCERTQSPFHKDCLQRQSLPQEQSPQGQSWELEGVTSTRTVLQSGACRASVPPGQLEIRRWPCLSTPT
jgi:hypothetical protein